MEINPFILGAGVTVSRDTGNVTISGARVGRLSAVGVSVLANTINVGVFVKVGVGTVGVALGTAVRV
jgi:hypothetical protein